MEEVQGNRSNSFYCLHEMGVIIIFYNKRNVGNGKGEVKLRKEQIIWQLLDRTGKRANQLENLKGQLESIWGSREVWGHKYMSSPRVTAVGYM